MSEDESLAPEVIETESIRTLAGPRTYAVWLVLLVLFLLIHGLGIWGFVLYELAQGRAVESRLMVYQSLQLFVLESGAIASPIPWQLELARWLAPALTALAAVTLILNERLRRFLAGWNLKKHVLVCGLGAKAMPLIDDLHRRGKRVAVCEADADHPLIATCRRLKIPVFLGRPSRTEVLKQAKLHRATHVICASDDDLLNLQVAAGAKHIVQQAGPSKKSFRCFVHLEDLVVCRNLRDAEMARNGERNFPVDYFNANEMGAQHLLHKYETHLESRLAGKPTHLLIVGLGRMGETLILEAGRLWRHGDAWQKGRQRLLVTAVDHNAGECVESLDGRFPQLKEICQLKPVSLANRDVADSCAYAFDDAAPVSIAFVCPKDESFALETALRLYRRCFEKERTFPIVLRTTTGRAIKSLLPDHRARGNSFAQLDVFSLYEETCRLPNLTGIREQLAQALHLYLSQHVKSQQPHARQQWGIGLAWHKLPRVTQESYLEEIDNLREALHLSDDRFYRVVRLTRVNAPDVFVEQDEVRIAMRDHQLFCADGKGLPRSTKPWDELNDSQRAFLIQRVRHLPNILEQRDLQLQLHQAC